jgi:hypothetical protein
VRKFVNLKLIYYSPVYIENRADIDCVKTLYLMEYKILYNFFNEHVDIDDFFRNCKDRSTEDIKLRLRSIKNFSDIQSNFDFTPKKNIESNYISFWIIFSFSVITIISAFLMHQIYQKLMKKRSSKYEYKICEMNQNSEVQLISITYL